MVGDDPARESQRLRDAVEALRVSVDELMADAGGDAEQAQVLEAYRMFANDQGWSHKLHEAVAPGLTAEAAVERVQSDTRARMLRSTDPYLRDRLHDLEDLGHRLMRQLVGQDHAPSREQLPDNAIYQTPGSLGPPGTMGSATTPDWVEWIPGSGIWLPDDTLRSP